LVVAVELVETLHRSLEKQIPVAAVAVRQTLTPR
jgi:hypothetical protein